MNASNEIMRLTELAKSFSTPPDMLTKTGPSPTKVVPGQIWECNTQVEKVPLRVLVLETGAQAPNGEETSLVAPLLWDSAFAGPEDGILPKEVLGRRVAVSAGLSASSTRCALKQCLGKIPSVWATKLRHILGYLEGARATPPRIERGIDYLDEQDLRYRHHLMIASGMAKVQATAVASLESRSSLPAPGSIIDISDMFKVPAKDALKMAAKGRTRGPIPTIRYGADKGRIRLKVSQCIDNPNHLAIEVAADPELVLENAVIVDIKGKTVGHIRKREATFRRPKGDQIVIRTVQGSELRFTKTLSGKR